MPSNTHFTSCDICQKSIKTGEQHLTLNFHKETGGNHNGKMSVTVHFAATTMKTSLDCGRPLAAFVLSDELKEEVNVRRLSASDPTQEINYVKKEKHSEIEKVS